MKTGHGGNIFSAAQILGCRPSDLVDMSSNLNPLGPPPGLLEYLKTRMDEVCRLPEPDAASCSAAYARGHGIDPDSVLAANGTTQFIYDLPRALDTRCALIIGPTYSDYARACRLHGIDTHLWKASAEQRYAPDLEEAVSGCPQADTIFVCNPNNPTGALLDRDDLASFCRRHPRIRLVVDESYLPFVPDAGRHSLLTVHLDNLIVLSSLSKIFRIPGLRIGFASGSPSLIRRLSAFGLPWNVNAPAQAAVRYLSAQAEGISLFIRQSHRYIEDEKAGCLPALDAVPGLRTFSGYPPYALVELPPGWASGAVVEHFLKQRILIRDCANFEGLGARYIRFSLKSRPDNRRFVRELSALLTKR